MAIVLQGIWHKASPNRPFMSCGHACILAFLVLLLLGRNDAAYHGQVCENKGDSEAAAIELVQLSAHSMQPPLKHILMIYAGQLRSFDTTVQHHFDAFILPNEADGWTFDIVVNTDLSDPQSPAAIRASFAPRPVTLIDDQPQGFKDVGFIWGRVARSLKYIRENETNRTSSTAGLPEFDAVFFTRPDAVFKPVGNAPVKFSITNQCTEYPGLSFLTNSCVRDCEFHNQDWDLMHLMCGGSRKHLEMMETAYADPGGGCSEDNCVGGEPPALPPDFFSSMPWSCSTQMCNFVAEVSKAGMRFGTMNRTYFSSLQELTKCEKWKLEAEQGGR